MANPLAPPALRSDRPPVPPRVAAKSHRKSRSTAPGAISHRAREAARLATTVAGAGFELRNGDTGTLIDIRSGICDGQTINNVPAGNYRLHSKRNNYTGTYKLALHAS